MTLFLTPDELHELTGYRQPAKQIAQLRRLGLPFFPNAAGQPKVARAIIEGTNSKPATTTSWRPKWADTQA